MATTRSIIGLALLLLIASPANATIEATPDENGRLKGVIGTAFGAHITGTIAGFINYPLWVGVSGETLAFTSDLALKATPPAFARIPDKVLAKDPGACNVTLTLDMTEAERKNLYGLTFMQTPGQDRPVSLGIDNRSWGPLVNPGEMDVFHLNSDVSVSVSHPGIHPTGNTEPNFRGKSVCEDNIALNDHACYAVTLPEGLHNFDWQAQTQLNPLTDLVFPGAMLAVMIYSEIKASYAIKKINQDGDVLTEIINNPANAHYIDPQVAEDIRLDLVRKWIKLAEQKPFKREISNFLAEEGVTFVGDMLTGAFNRSYARNRFTQRVSVPDTHTPVIAATIPHVTLEASDFGGTRLARVYDELTDNLDYSDACNSNLRLSHDAPNILPLGSGTINWTVTDVPVGVNPAEYYAPGYDSSASVQMTYTVADTQPPILVAPAGKVIEAVGPTVDPAGINLGTPKVIDLADPAPMVTNDVPAAFNVDSRVAVNWTATDASGNSVSKVQWITAKTPNTNTPPTTSDVTAATRTGEAVEIRLDGVDVDSLPTSRGGEILDPLSFEIIAYPANGEFIAPLRPFFIEDFRLTPVGETEREGVRTSPLGANAAEFAALATAQERAMFLEQRYCDLGNPIPVNFPYEPTYVHVADSGNYYIRDSFWECTGLLGRNTPVERERISKWDENQHLLAQFKLSELTGLLGNCLVCQSDIFTVDEDENVWWQVYGVLGNVIGLNRVNRNLADPRRLVFVPLVSSPDGRAWTNAHSDPNSGLIYVNDNRGIAVFSRDTLAVSVSLTDFLDASLQVAPIGRLTVNGNPLFFADQGCGLDTDRKFWMTTDSKSNLYVTEACTNRIHKFGPSARRPDGSFAAGSYIGWMGRCSGNVAPWSGCDADSQTSRGYACDDTKCLRSTTAGASPGQFDRPIHIALDPKDTLYVADFNNQRVQRFGDDGSFAGQAVSEGSGINQGDAPGFVLGNIGSPRAVAVNSSTLFIMQSEAAFDYFLHSFKTLPFDPIEANGQDLDADGDGYVDNSVLIRYVPRFNFPGGTGQAIGQDQFRFRVNDGLVDSADASVTITVTRNFRPPEDLAIRCYRPAAPARRVNCGLDEDTDLLVEFIAKDPDGVVGFDGLDMLSYSAVQPVHGTLTLQSSTAASAIYLYTPDKDFNGAETIAYSVNDGTTFDDNGVVEVHGEFALEILPVPDAPVLTIDEPVVAGRGFPTTITASYTDVDDNPDELPPSARVDWGDGVVEAQGEIVEDANGDLVMTGPLLTPMSSARGVAQGSHVFNTNGVQSVTVCLQPTDLPGQVCEVQPLEVIDATKVTVTVNPVDVVDTLSLRPFTLRYEIEIANLVPEGWDGIDARNVELTIDVPPNLIPVTAGSDCRYTLSLRQYRCSFGDLAPGENVKKYISMFVNLLVPPRSKVTLDARVTHASPDVSADISASTLVLIQWPDSDEDKLPDRWEVHYFGSRTASTGDSDSDTDGLTDVEEYYAGTDPTRLDSDSDGVPDFDEVNEYLTDPNSVDTDADGLPDQWEIQAGVDPNSAEDSRLDPDEDSLATFEEYGAGTDPRNPDSDTDGLPDGWEVTNGLDPLVDDTGLDADGDGRSNLAEYLEGGDPQRDDIPPGLTPPADITVDATGALTVVALGTATASDVKDGALMPIAINPGPFAPGAHTVIWRATDAAGNSAQATQNVNVVPMVSFAVDRTVTEGTTVQVVVELNGPAVTYPVTIPYVVSGSALNPSDHNAANGTIQIDSGISASIAINIVNDAMPESDESLVLTMGAPTNAVPGAKNTHTITIVERNVAPRITITVEQLGEFHTTIAADASEVSVSAAVQDSTEDSHSYNWSASDADVMDSMDYTDESYLIDPVALNNGIYGVRVRVTDDGVPNASTNASTLMKIVSASPALDSGVDSDGDGLSDADEGIADTDGDRIPDYLDDLPNTNMLRMSDDGRVLETNTGLQLRLGPTVFEEGGINSVLAEATLEEEANYGYPNGVVDFELTGIEPRSTAQVVYPLKRPLPANSVYRKYINGSWQDFVIDDNNSLSSAPGQGGACPPPGSNLYEAGLTVGHGCIQLTLEDGGPNDADNEVNGSIQDPGGLAVPVGVRLELVTVADQTVSAGSETVVMRVHLSSDSGDVELSSLTLQAFGRGDDRAIGDVKLIVDSNANGLVDDTDEIITNGQFDQDNGTLKLNMFQPYQIPAGDTYLLVTLLL